MTELLYKAVIADIDGTLVQYRPDLSDLGEADALISDSTVKAIARLQLAGVAVAAVTGRTYEQSRDVLISLGINGPCVFAGGAAIREIPSGKILHEASLDAGVLENVRGILFSELGDDYPLDLAPSASHPNQYNSVWVIMKADRIAKVLEELSKVENIYYVVNKGAGQASQVGLLVLSGGADKGSGTRRLLSLLDVSREEVACIGDGANDVLMFEECGLGIAMGNGEEILKRSADLIVSDIEHDGFAEAVSTILESIPTTVNL